MQKIVLSMMMLSAVLVAKPSPVEQLSPQLRALLVAEMSYIEEGMQDILSYIVRGEFEKVLTRATKIQNSFVFSKQMTPALVKELTHGLPKGFKTLDARFHVAAGNLANSAEFGDTAKMVQSYNTMMKQCVACHSTYATHRFSTFDE